MKTSRGFTLVSKACQGFTLVELLIVISLLSAIALTVIAAINPLEQANRARDTRYKADAGQLISAIDRYFAARSEFPWVTSGAGVLTNDSAFGFVKANDVGVGLCGDAACSTVGTLISADELKTEFKNRDFIRKAALEEQSLFLGKAEGASASIYACFIPMSKSVRKSAVTDLKVYTIDTASGARTSTSICNADSANWITSHCYVCIPE